MMYVIIISFAIHRHTLHRWSSLNNSDQMVSLPYYHAPTIAAVDDDDLLI
jgi:hypothetical protein